MNDNEYEELEREFDEPDSQENEHKKPEKSVVEPEDDYLNEPEEGETEENEPEEEQEEERRYDPKDVIRQLQREKFQALARTKALEQQVHHLSISEAEAVSVAIKNYGEAVSYRLKNARDLYEFSEESGNVEQKRVANEELAFALGEQAELDKLKKKHNINDSKESNNYAETNQRNNNYQADNYGNYQNNYNNNQPAQEEVYPNIQLEYKIWSENRPFLNKKSGGFDKELYDYMSWYATSFENNLRMDGKSYYIGSPDYFEQLDKGIDEFRSKRGNNGNVRVSKDRGLNMKSARGSVSPVRSGNASSGVSSSPEKKKYNLSKAYIEMARLMGSKDLNKSAEYYRAFQAKKREQYNKMNGK